MAAEERRILVTGGTQGIGAALVKHARAKGHAVVFAAPAELKQGVEVWGPAPTTISLQREIKRQFDPKGLLNPGRFLAGI